MTIGDRVIWILPISKVNRQVRRIVAAGASSWATKVCCPASWAAKGSNTDVTKMWFWLLMVLGMERCKSLKIQWLFKHKSRCQMLSGFFQDDAQPRRRAKFPRPYGSPACFGTGKTSVVAGAPSHDSNVERSQRSERSWSSMPRRRQFMKTVDLQAWNIWGTP